MGLTADEIVDKMLADDEGIEHHAYSDPLTHSTPYTIGEGHTGPEVKADTVFNDDQIEFAAQLDKGSAWQVCFDHFEPWFNQLTPARQAVLVCMAFQMGAARLLGFVNTLANVRDGHYANAAEGMRQSVWARQTPKRAIRMAYQMETGEPQWA